MQARTGGQVLVEQLATHSTEIVFCVPGESYLAVLDAMFDRRDSIRLITCRHEGGAAMMAQAFGRLTGRPGICFVTRGPGATNASIGVHIAAEDSTPMILFVGQAPRYSRHRGGFQEVDLVGVFSPVVKWAIEIDNAERLPEFVARAYSVAMSGRPGPVLVALPEDMLSDRVEVTDASATVVQGPAPVPEVVDRARKLIAGAQRPLVIAGGTGWSSDSSGELQRWAERSGVPVVCSFRRHDLVDNASPAYAGYLGLGNDPLLQQRVRAADVVLAVGTRLSELTTGGYRLIDPPVPIQQVVHVHPDPAELGRVYQPELAINSAVVPFIAALTATPVTAAGRDPDWFKSARVDYELFRSPPAATESTSFVDMSQVMVVLGRVLPLDAIVSNGAGNYTGWVNRYYTFRKFGTMLAPTAGAMGYGLPAAIAAKLLHPFRVVVAFAGDGCLLMNGQEMATAVAYGAAVIVLVVNNGRLGTIRMHQERQYPGRVIGTDLKNPDFVAWAHSFGAYAERVEHAAQFEAALGRAREARRPALLELVTDPDVLSPTLSVQPW